MHFVSEPLLLYPMFSLIAFIAAILVNYDLSLIRVRRRTARGAAAELLAATYKSQRWLAYLTVASFVLALISAAIVETYADLFVVNHLHVVLGAMFLIYFVGLLVREYVETGKVRTAILKRTAAQIAVDAKGEAERSSPANPAG